MTSSMHTFLTQKLLPLIAPQSLAIDRQTLTEEEIRVATELNVRQLTRPGDLILIATPGGFYELFRRLTGNPFDHVAVVVGGGKALHVGPPKARLLSVERLLIPSRRPLLLRPAGMTVTERVAFVAACEQFVGTLYDVPRVYDFMFRLGLAHHVGPRLPFARVAHVDARILVPTASLTADSQCGDGGETSLATTSSAIVSLPSPSSVPSSASTPAVSSSASVDDLHATTLPWICSDAIMWLLLSHYGALREEALLISGPDAAAVALTLTNSSASHSTITGSSSIVSNVWAMRPAWMGKSSSSSTDSAHGSATDSSRRGWRRLVQNMRLASANSTHSTTDSSPPASSPTKPTNISHSPIVAPETVPPAVPIPAHGLDYALFGSSSLNDFLTLQRRRGDLLSPIPLPTLPVDAAQLTGAMPPSSPASFKSVDVLNTRNAVGAAALSVAQSAHRAATDIVRAAFESAPEHAPAIARTLAATLAWRLVRGSGSARTGVEANAKTELKLSKL